MNTVFARVTAATSLWAAPLVVLLVAAASHRFRDGIPYSLYTFFIWLGSALMVAVLLVGVVRATKYVPPVDAAVAGDKVWFSDPLLVSILVFWALFPPSFFFVEYYILDHELIAWPKERWNGEAWTNKDQFLAHTKGYADQAAKIWAGASAVFGATIAWAKRSA